MPLLTELENGFLPPFYKDATPDGVVLKDLMAKTQLSMLLIIRTTGRLKPPAIAIS
jgi:hypothetical protein